MRLKRKHSPPGTRNTKVECYEGPESAKWAKEAGATGLHVDPALNQALVQEACSSQTPLVGQWLILHASETRGPGSTPGQGIRFHMLQ